METSRRQHNKQGYVWIKTKKEAVEWEEMNALELQEFKWSERGGACKDNWGQTRNSEMKQSMNKWIIANTYYLLCTNAILGILPVFITSYTALCGRHYYQLHYEDDEMEPEKA